MGRFSVMLVVVGLASVAAPGVYLVRVLGCDGSAARKVLLAR